MNMELHDVFESQGECLSMAELSGDRERWKNEPGAKSSGEWWLI